MGDGRNIIDADWDVFECGGGILEIQRVDLPEHRVNEESVFKDDEEAAGYVLSMAQWNSNPNKDERDKCREAVRKVVESWDNW